MEPKWAVWLYTATYALCCQRLFQSIWRIASNQ
jgi:hypothetical protein